MSVASETPTTQLAAGTWTVDPSHSSVGFAVRHLMVTKVRGTFETFNGTLTVAENPLDSRVEAVVELASVKTGDAARDTHLLSSDFFGVEEFPTMTLRSTSLRPDGSDYVLVADLTIKGITHSVEFALTFDGTATDPWGNAKAGFSAEAEINRRDWGMEFNMALDTGGVMVGEKVKIQLDIQAAKA